MQNPHVKYLKTKENQFYLFYNEQDRILCRHYGTDGWTPPKTIAEKTSSVFSLCQYENVTYLLYSQPDGQLFLASSSDFCQWEHHAFSEKLSPNKRTSFFLLPTEDTFHLIYHQPTESAGIDTLLYTSFQKGSWQKPYPIDRFLPMQNPPFLARRLSREHIILYYRTGRNILSAREILLEPYTMGSVTPLIQSPSLWSDLSIVNDNDRIHILYIVRGMFRTQVVYQYKHTSAISTPRIVWEDTHCDSCMVYLQEEKVILMWTVKGQPMRCISHDNGSSFGAVETYTEPFPARCIKAELTGASADPFNSAECYGDPIDFLPAVYPLSSLLPPKCPFRQMLPTHDCTVLQETHDQQTAALSALLKQRTEEIAAVNARWKRKTERLEKELTALRQENAVLKLKFLKTEHTL